MSTTLSRKQKEIADRHALFLDIAYQLFCSDGWLQLNMNKIAEQAEYSKGTVYQHFHCKEEVLIQLCNQCMQHLSDLFSRAVEFDGTHRERMAAVFLAKDLWSRLRPKNQDLLQTLCADGIKDKVSQESLDLHYALETGLINVAAKIVQDALQSGDLPPLKQLGPYDLVFGLWSLSYGGQQLISFNLPLQRLGIANPPQALFASHTALLDGLNWRPLSSELDYQARLERIGEEVFASEIAEMKSREI